MRPTRPCRCGPRLAACVYFSNTTSRATLGTPATTIDIVQEMIDKHNFPEWSVRSDYYWPVYRSAQLRFLPALHWLRERVTANPATNPKTAQYFGAAKWVLLVDDDTFVFYHNLKIHLESLDPTRKIYTGLVSPSGWLPTKLNNVGHSETGRDPHVNSYDLFINGGSGSVFSLAALQALDTQDCVDEMKPSGKWWQWQSDWAVGSCARRRSIFPHPAPRGKFNQFICVDKEQRPFYCETYEQRAMRNATEGMLAWNTGAKRLLDQLDGPLVEPATIHPIKSAEGFEYLWTHYAFSYDNYARNVQQAREALDVAPVVLRDTRITTVDAMSYDAEAAGSSMPAVMAMQWRGGDDGAAPL